jgi:hypothetical protein
VIRRVFKAFQYRDFRLLWIGACTSSIGTWMQIVAQSWLVYKISGSARMLGLDAFLGNIPIFLFSLIGAFYYLRVVKLMYFDAPEDASPLPSTADVRTLLTVNGLAVLVLGLLPGGLMDLCQRAIQASL